MPDSNIIQIDQNLFETKLDRLVTEKMTQILNAMLDAEADEITGAARYERKEGRKAYRAGHYERTLTAKAGRLELRVPKLKGAVFESAVIERYRRRESSVEEALMEMCLAGVSTRQVDDISKLLWGDRMPSQTLSDKLKRVYDDIDRWRTRPLESEYPYVFMDGVWHKRSWGGSVENVSVLVAIGVNAEGHREGIGETTAYLLPEFPTEHRRRIRTNNMIERLNREIRRRTRVVGSFPDGNSALMLICARTRYVTANEWSTRRYLDMSRLDDNLQEAN
jgi:transposase-like protein